jgi:mannose-6-phosphate isomerase
MAVDYPLRFQPNYRRYIWGGRRLETVLGKSLGEGDDYAESWEIVDRGEDQSIVAAGPLAGRQLGQLVREQGADLLGRHHPQPCFPLLFKFLDAQKRLSVQVHPNDEAAAQLDPPDLGKTEAWVVLATEPYSTIYAGLRRGFNRATVEQEVARGTTEVCLHQIVPHVGDCIFLPAGVVHAAGEGLVIAEIQQASDTTFRLFDWNRVGKDGKPRELHVEQALAAINFDFGAVEPQSPQATDKPFVERLVHCDKFVLDRWRMNAPQSVGGDDRCHIVAVIGGSVAVESDPAEQPLRLGQTMLLPAAAGPLELSPNQPSTLLDMYLP